MTRAAYAAKKLIVGWMHYCMHRRKNSLSFKIISGSQETRLKDLRGVRGSADPWRHRTLRSTGRGGGPDWLGSAG